MNRVRVGCVGVGYIDALQCLCFMHPLCPGDLVVHLAGSINDINLVDHCLLHGAMKLRNESVTSNTSDCDEPDDSN